MRAIRSIQILLCTFGILLPLLLASCSPSEKQLESSAASINKWEALPVQFSVAPEISQDKAINADLHDAAEFWNQRVGSTVIAFIDDYKGPIPPPTSETDKSIFPLNVIYLHPNWPFSNEMAGKTTLTIQIGKIRNALISINTNLKFCAGDCELFPDKVSRRKVFAHEFGHALGLKHSESINDIMYPTATPGGILDNLTIPEASLRDLLEI